MRSAPLPQHSHVLSDLGVSSGPGSSPLFRAGSHSDAVGFLCSYLPTVQCAVSSVQLCRTHKGREPCLHRCAALYRDSPVTSRHPPQVPSFTVSPPLLVLQLLACSVLTVLLRLMGSYKTLPWGLPLISMHLRCILGLGYSSVGRVPA